MSATLLLVQTLNGLQFGIILFLIAAGLTLVFGVMDFINLAHGVQYMVGAYFAAAFVAWTGSFAAGLALALPAALAFGLLLEVVVFRHLYDRDHLDQVLATFGIILFLNQGVKAVWGAAPLFVPIPPALSGSIELMPGLLYPVYRLAIIAAGLGRQHPDPRLRRHRHRRHRLDPRRLSRRAPRRPRRHARALLRLEHPAPRARPLDGEPDRPGDRPDADLHPDGGGPVLPADRPLPREAVTGLPAEAAQTAVAPRARP